MKPYCPCCLNPIGVRYVEKITPSKYAFEFTCNRCRFTVSVVTDSGVSDAVRIYKDTWNSKTDF